MSFDSHSDSLFSEDEDDFCPLCVEEMDITDKNFKPCPCGYQICQFCYNNIRTNPELNGKCPACRRLYEDKNIEYRNITAEEWKLQKAKIEKRKREKKIIEKEKKDAEQAKRHHLAGMRVIQKNLVYVVGLNPPCSYDDLIPVLRSDKYFGQYGKINKIVINKRNPNPNNFHHMSSNPGYGVYVTFAKKEDATKCIAAVDGSISDGKLLRAAHGTTKYCSSYLRGQPCPNPNCMFLHEPGEEADSYSRQDLSTKPGNKVPERTSSHGLGNIVDDFTDSPQNSPHISIAQLNSSNSNINLNQSNISSSHEQEGPALPATVSWAKNKSQPTFTHMSDPITASLSAYPTLSDVHQQNKINSFQNDLQQQANQQQQQQQLQQLLQKSQMLQKQQEQQNQEQPQKKKEKKDKDQKHPIVLESSAITFKSICDSLKNINDSQINYSINPKFKTSEFAITSSNFKLYHPMDLSKMEEQSFGFFNDDESKERISTLTDSLLFFPNTRNYNYKAYVQALQTSQLQALQTARAAQSESINQLEQPELQMTPSQLPPQMQLKQVQDSGNVSSTQAFLQQRLMQQQQLKMQQNGLKTGSGSVSGTPIQQPPGLFKTTNDSKSNSQELLSQLMGKKVSV